MAKHNKNPFMQGRNYFIPVIFITLFLIITISAQVVNSQFDVCIDTCEASGDSSTCINICNETFDKINENLSIIQFERLGGLNTQWIISWVLIIAVGGFLVNWGILSLKE